MTIKTTDKYGLRERAILVRITTTMLGVSKKDKKASTDAAEKYNADSRAVSVNKNIWNVNNPIYKAIKTARGLITNTGEALTGPWSDSGWRVVSTQGYGNFRQVLDDLTADFYAKVEVFVKEYDSLKSEARRMLGSLYDESLYLPVEEIRDAFRITIETEVLPDRSNVILDLDAARAEQIVADAVANDQRRTKALTDDTHKRLREELEGMVIALREYGDANPGKKRNRSFKNSLVSRMAQMADLLPALNITGDPKMNKLGQKIAADLTVLSADDLRGNKKPGDNRSEGRREAEAATNRETTADKAEAILDDLDGVFGDAA